MSFDNDDGRFAEKGKDNVAYNATEEAKDGDIRMTSLSSPNEFNEKQPKTPPTDKNLTPDDILHQLGGCGRFQVLLAVVIQVMKSVVCWGMVGNIFISFVPRWRCIDDDYDDVTSAYNTSHMFNTSMSNSSNDAKDSFWNEQCTSRSGQTCKSFEFESHIDTIVSQFDLVCDYSWVTATIVSMQMAGMCVGSVLAGQLADSIGRKPPIMLSMAVLGTFHLISYFSVNWIMFAIGRIFIGVGSSVFLSIYCTIQSEYTLSKWRSIVIGFPSWALEASVFALVAWLLHDWQKLTLTMTVMAFAFLSAWGFVPESFRWFIAKKRYEEAKVIVSNVSKWNKHPELDFERMREAVMAQQAKGSSKQYTVIEIFRRRALLKVTVPLMMCWLTMGFTSYGINFGVQKLSGNIYLNIFLFSIASLPSKVISIFLQNRFGRKIASIIAYAVCLIGGLTVGIVQYIDTPHRDSLTNYFALAANAGVDGTWGPMQTLTVELYPTVLRNNAFGFLSMLARVGAVIGPQFVYLSDMVPGLLYFMVALTSFLSIIGTMLVPETMDTVLVDNIMDDFNNARKKEHPTA